MHGGGWMLMDAINLRYLNGNILQGKAKSVVVTWWLRKLTGFNN